MKRYQIPRLVFINKLDRAGANPWTAIEKLRGKLGLNAAAVQVPIGLEDKLAGLVDLVEMRAWRFEGPYGERPITIEIPVEVEDRVQERRQALIEALAEIDEPLADAFLSDKPIDASMLKGAIRRGTIARSFVPVFMGSAYKNCGVQLLLDGVRDYLPSPPEVSNFALDREDKKHLLRSDDDAPLVALAFKLEEGRFGQLTYMRVYQGKMAARTAHITNIQSGKRIKIPRLVRMHSDEMADVESICAGEIGAMFGVECASGDTFTDGTLELSMTPMHVPEPVISLAVKPRGSTANMEKFSKALNRFQREDPTLRVHVDADSGETILSGMGELHLDIYLERMRREYGCETDSGKPRVAYRETTTKRASFDYQHKKQTGGAGQYARVMGFIEPATENGFVNKVVGGTVPTQFIPACEKGFREGIARGPLTGHPVVNCEFHLVEGVAHVVDSNEHAFKAASYHAFRQAFAVSAPILLEPMMKATVQTPVEFQGSVVSSLTKRRAIINDTETTADGSTSTITVEVPLADMFGYSTELRSATQGKGEFSMEYLEHRPVMKETQAQLVAAHSATPLKE